MSGGHFNYDQYKIEQIADDIEQIIFSNNTNKVDQYGDRLGYRFTQKTIAKFQKTVSLLRQARIYVQRIDWLVSGDDGEETFLRRLMQELSAAKQERQKNEI